MKKRRAVIIIAVAVIGVIFFYFGYIANNYGPQDLSDIRDACINMKEDEECVCTTMDIPPKICRVVKKSPPTEDLVITVENIYTAFPDYDLTPFYEFRRSEEITDVETVMLSNSNQFYTLERDFPHKNSIVYFTQDGSRVYFVLGEGGEWGCYKLNYLDTRESRYKKTDLDYCPGMVWGTQAENLRPFIIQGGKFFHNDDLYALNLETRKRPSFLRLLL